MKKKMEYSKKILLFLMIMEVAIIIYSMALMWHVETAEPLMYLIPALSAELSIAIGFYYNKAKREFELRISLTKEILISLVEKILKIKVDEVEKEDEEQDL